MNERVLTLDEPMAHQVPILEHPARHKLLRCGRRYGKTGVMFHAAVAGHGPARRWRGLLQGATIGWLHPQLKQAPLLWMDLKAALEPVTVRKNEDDLTIEVLGGGLLILRSCEQKEVTRGLKLTGAIIDEAKQHRAELWKDEVSPALKDSKGWAFIGGTPGDPDNWFSQKCEQVPELGPNWHHWHAPSSDNPLMDAEEMESARLESGPFTYEREYLANIITATGGDFFPAEWLRYFDLEGDTYRLDTRTFKREQLEVFIVEDLAATKKKRSDFSAIGVFGITPDRHLLLLDVICSKLDGAEIVKKTLELHKKWNAVVHVEANAYSSQLIAVMRNAGIPVRELIADKGKIERAAAAQPFAEQGRCWFPRRARWLDKFRSELFAFPPSEKSGHDDQVDMWTYGCAVAFPRSGARLSNMGNAANRERRRPGAGIPDLDLPPP